MSLAPIILFTYNRPWHTEQTLNALMQNELADQSTLFIYCDGPKEDGTEQQLERISQVRQIIQKKKWCKEVNVIKRSKNIGLVNSIFQGVDEIIDNYEKVIVLEDDLITSKAFLKYMNFALDYFQDDDIVGSINSWMLPIKNMPNFYFKRGGDCWGWGTWKNSWKLLERNPLNLLQRVNSYDMDDDFHDSWLDLLYAVIDGSAQSWWIRWHLSLFLNNQLGLYPGKTYTYSIGLDGSGTNCTSSGKVVRQALSESFDPKNLYNLKKEASRKVDSKIISYEESFREKKLILKIFKRLKAHF
jgi:hypothetical protein